MDGAGSSAAFIAKAEQTEQKEKGVKGRKEVKKNIVGLFNSKKNGFGQVRLKREREREIIMIKSPYLIYKNFYSYVSLLK